MTLDIPGLRPIVNNNNCSSISPPACLPAADQVALYADPDYGGACSIVNIGDYDAPPEAFGNIGNNNIESLLVGSDVRLTMWTHAYYAGADETFDTSDSNLMDNRIRPNSVSSIKVTSRSTLPLAPVLFPVTATDQNAIILRWNGTFSTLYTAELRNCPDGSGCAAPPTFTQSMPASNTNTWSLPGPLPAGTYQWSVAGINTAGTGPAAINIFTVSTGSPPSNSPFPAPFFDDFESGEGEWTYSGLWHWTELSRDGISTHTFVFNDGTDYQTNGFPSGDLTSPPIILPAGIPHELQFKFLTGTESNREFWDQMRIQITNLSTDGKYVEAWQVIDQPQVTWLNSPRIDLSAFSGQTIRIRFHFNALDDIDNQGFGWAVDDIAIQPASAPPPCMESSPNDTRLMATSITMGQTVNGIICPQGDLDYYSISGQAGQRLSTLVKAGTIGSSLIPIITLYDSAGKFLREQDTPDDNGDISFGYQLPAAGKYYIRIKAWDHPSAGGEDAFYQLSTSINSVPPIVNIQFPINRYIPINGFTATALASSTPPGQVDSVSFYWRNSNWMNSNWILIHTDADPSDGFSAYIDPSQVGNLSGGGLYVEARDSTGNRTGAIRLYLEADVTPPVTQVEPFPNPSRSTALHLRWTSSDSGTGIDHFDVEYQIGTGQWQLLAADLPSNQNSLWYLSEFNQTVSFRVRGVDAAGNVEPFRTVTTTVEADCIPDDHEDGDDEISGAVLLEPYQRQSHNLCQLNDTDWIQFIGKTGDDLLIGVTQLTGGAAIQLDLYDSELNVLASTAARDFNQPAILHWMAPGDAIYYLKLTPIHPNLAGTEAGYSIWYGPALTFYLPVVFR